MTLKAFWHDGVIQAIRIAVANRRRFGSIEFDLLLYPTGTSADRVAHTLFFKKVSSFQIVGSMFDLADNSSAGNIEDAEFEEREASVDVKLRLVTGEILITAAQVRLMKRSEPPPSRASRSRRS